MAYDDKGTKREVASLLSRYPKPDRAKEEALAAMRDAQMRQEMGRRYDEIMPSPEPGETKPRKFAKGGSVSSRADGCCQRGKTKGRFV